MAWTQAQIDRLETAIDKGAVLQSLTVAGQTFTFRSLDEMQRLLAQMRRELAASGGSQTRYVASCKGV